MKTENHDSKSETSGLTANVETTASPHGQSHRPAACARPVNEKPRVHWGWLTMTLVLIAATVILTLPTGGTCIDYADAPGVCTTDNLIGADPVWPWQLAGFAAVVWCACKSNPSGR